MTTTLNILSMGPFDDVADKTITINKTPVGDTDVVRLEDVATFISAPYFISTITEAAGQSLVVGELIYLHTDGWKRADPDVEASQAVVFAVGPPILAVVLGVMNLATVNAGLSQGDRLFLAAGGKVDSEWPGVSGIMQEAGFVISQTSPTLVLAMFMPRILTTGI